jgi:hypothetical protein
MAAQGEFDAIHGAEQVHHQREFAAPGPFKEQRRPALADDALDDFGNLEARIHFGRHAAELAAAFQGRDEAAEVGEGRVVERRQTNER